MLKILIVLVGFISAASWANNVVYVTEWVTEEELESTILEMEDKRLFPCTVEGRTQDDEIFYRASYCAFIGGMHSFHTKWGLPADSYEKWSEYYASVGMVERFHTIFIDPNGVIAHQATWILIDESQFETEAEDYTEEE